VVRLSFVTRPDATHTHTHTSRSQPTRHAIYIQNYGRRSRTRAPWLARRTPVQNGYLLRRGGCQNRWHSLVNCNHDDSASSRFRLTCPASNACTLTCHTRAHTHTQPVNHPPITQHTQHTQHTCSAHTQQIEHPLHPLHPHTNTPRPRSSCTCRSTNRGRRAATVRCRPPWAPAASAHRPCAVQTRQTQTNRQT
jgi:hypothetical protein